MPETTGKKVTIEQVIELVEFVLGKLDPAPQTKTQWILFVASIIEFMVQKEWTLGEAQNVMRLAAPILKFAAK